MRRPFRLLGWLLAGVVSLVLLAVAGVAGLLWVTLPPGRQTLALAGLSAPVDVTFDADGVPRIAAATEADAATALGYVHARDRMFQMELMRRAASGRLSEIAGAATLRLDRTMRTLGLRRRAEADLAAMPADLRLLLDRYAAGVNAWTAQRGRLAAPEFVLLGAPEPWTPTDSLLWGKTMGLYLSGNWRQELSRAALLRTVPAARVDQLWPAHDATPQPDAALPDPTPDPALPARSRLAGLVPGFPEPFTLPGSASNGWAVDGRHSATGAPLLAGDPHLSYSQPGIWYLARIDTPAGTLVGATAPGVPILVLGHNGRIAWTFTTTGADTQDVFVETVLADGRYASPDGPQAFTTREERIRVRGGEDQIMTVRETRHGPVISDLDEPGGPVLALAAANLAPGDPAAGLLALNRANDVDAAGQAAAAIVAPVQNLIVADRARVAQFTTGRVPLRRAGDGRIPVPGADGAHDWTGFASGASLPRYVDPASGRVVNANERVAGPDFPVFLGADWFADFRARRIRALLDAKPKHDLAGFAAMQVDDRSEFARDVLPALRAAPAADGLPRRAQALLAHWDGAMDIDLPQPLILNAWVRRFNKLVLERGGVPGSGGPRADFVAWVLSPAGAGWCGGDCGPLLADALASSAAALAERFGPDPSAWRWGQAHEALFPHPILGLLPVVGPLTTASIEQPGDDTTVYRGSTRSDGFASVHGAGFRGVYDLADLERSRFIAVPGQSGHQLARHARDKMRRWRDGDTVSLGKQVAVPSDTIRLHP